MLQEGQWWVPNIANVAVKRAEVPNTGLPSVMHQYDICYCECILDTKGVTSLSGSRNNITHYAVPFCLLRSEVQMDQLWLQGKVSKKGPTMASDSSTDTP